jgi:hypothetical protein
MVKHRAVKQLKENSENYPGIHEVVCLLVVPVLPWRAQSEPGPDPVIH